MWEGSALLAPIAVRSQPHTVQNRRPRPTANARRPGRDEAPSGVPSGRDARQVMTCRSSTRQSTTW
jgi:hypothetical protein